MFFYIILVFAFQICHCSAECDCSSCGIVLQTYAAYLIGFTISILFFTTVALAVMVYRLKRVKCNGSELFRNKRHVSINKYKRQLSGNSQLSYHIGSMEDDTVRLNDNEIKGMCNHDNSTYKDDSELTNEARVKKKAEPNEPQKTIFRQIKMPVFPQMQKEQMHAICEAVLKHHLKESTSLSDLDKIVNDSKVSERPKPKPTNLSASTPELDVYDVLPSPLPTKRVMERNSNELKLQEEIKAKFNKDKITEDGIKSENNHEKLTSKLNESEFNSKFINEEIKAKHKENKSKAIREDGAETKNVVSVKQNVNLDENVSNVVSGGTEKSTSEGVVQDEIYDSPPPPRPHNELYDFPPSHRPHSELFDFTQSTGPLNEMYECLPSGRNIIVADEDASGYLYPISNSNEALFDEPHYTNAKTRTGNDLL